MTRYVQTGLSILLSALYSMIHGSLQNFVGRDRIWLAGFCVWFDFSQPRSTNNLFYLFMLWLTDTYSAFGVWSHLPSICMLLLLLLSYLSLRVSVPLNRACSAFCSGTARGAQVHGTASIAFLIAFFAKTVFDVVSFQEDCVWIHKIAPREVPMAESGADDPAGVKRQRSTGCAGAMLLFDCCGVSVVLSVIVMFAANDVLALVKDLKMLLQSLLKRTPRHRR